MKYVANGPPLRFRKSVLKLTKDDFRFKDIASEAPRSKLIDKLFLLVFQSHFPPNLNLIAS